MHEELCFQFREHLFPQIEKYRKIAEADPDSEPDNFTWSYMAEMAKRHREKQDMGYFRSASRNKLKVLSKRLAVNGSCMCR